MPARLELAVAVVMAASSTHGQALSLGMMLQLYPYKGTDYCRLIVVVPARPASPGVEGVVVVWRRPLFLAVIVKRPPPLVDVSL